MIKPKQALVNDGFLPAGSENKKGRLSGDAIKRCEELAASGIAIEGYSVSQSNDSTAPVTVEKVKRDPNVVLDVPEPSRNEKDWIATVEGKRVGMREVCRRCSSSFTYCYCDKPLFPIDFDRFGVVVFKPTARTEGKR